VRFLRRPEEREGYFLEISVGCRPRRALEPAAGGMEEVLTGLDRKSRWRMAYAEVVSVEFLVVR
jgi:hypothetical protein